MELECTKRGDTVVLGPKGSVNTESAPKLEQKLLEQLNAGEKRFVLDFARVDYISSAGLRVLLMAAKRLKVAGGAMALCALSAGVSKVFALCGFERDFTIVADRDQAVARVTATPSASAPTRAPVSAGSVAPPVTDTPSAPASGSAVAKPAVAPPPRTLPEPTPASPSAAPPPTDAALLTQTLLVLASGLLARAHTGGRVTAPAELVERAKRVLALES